MSLIKLKAFLFLLELFQDAYQILPYFCNPSMKKTKPFILFYLLVAYVLLQFAWWAYHIVDLNDQIYLLKVQIEKLESPDQEGRQELLSVLDEKRNYRRLMVMGEGAVFFNPKGRK